MAFRRTKNFTWARAIANAMAAALKTVPGAALLVTPKVSLFSAGPLITPDVGVAAFTKCAFTGYADQTLTMGGPFNAGSLIQCMEGSVVFAQTGATGDIAIGYLLSDGVNAFYGAELFVDGSIPFVNSGDFLDVDLVLPTADFINVP